MPDRTASDPAGLADGGEPAIWVSSDLTPDGTYVTAVHASEDVSVALDRQQAVAYAAAVFTAVAYAEHDAAVYRQLVACGVDEMAAALAVVADLRPDRAPVNDAATAPLRFVPLVTASRQQPALYVEVNGRRIAQWTTGDGRQHAGHVLEICACVDLDAAYFHYLRGRIQLDDRRARAVVGTLGQHRAGGEQ